MNHIMIRSSKYSNELLKNRTLSDFKNCIPTTKQKNVKLIDVHKTEWKIINSARLSKCHGASCEYLKYYDKYQDLM